MQNYIDILPGEVAYFIADYAHRDTNQYNIFQFEFKNGAEAIPAYNAASNAGRIYIGFPTKDDNNNNVFDLDLGIGVLGSHVPCYFPTGADYASPLSSKKL